jgi:hypothetical protein
LGGGFGVKGFSFGVGNHPANPLFKGALKSPLKRGI